VLLCHAPGLLLTVGIMSSWNEPVVRTLTKELFPAFCSPISESSISFLKNRLHDTSTCVHELRLLVGTVSMHHASKCMYTTRHN
jgi:hypothetical protein